MIAITADPEGLLSNGTNCENFDRILPRPLDVAEVGRVVEEQAEIADRNVAVTPTTQRLETFAAPLPSVLEVLSHGCLAWPDDLEATPLSTRANQATLGDPRFDAIVVKRATSAEELVLYPVACSPQAWASGAMFYLLQSMLGLQIDGHQRTVRFVRPSIPQWLGHVELTNLVVGDARVSLRLASGLHGRPELVVLANESAATIEVVESA